MSDLIHAWRFYQGTTSYRRTGQVIAVFLLVVVILTVYAAGWRWYLLILVAFAVDAWFMLLQTGRCWLAYRANPQLFREPYLMTIDQGGVQLETSSLTARRTWSGYHEMLESDRAFLLVHGKSQYALIPKRAFSGPRQIAELHALAGARVQGAGSRQEPPDREDVGPAPS